MTSRHRAYLIQGAVTSVKTISKKPVRRNANGGVSSSSFEQKPVLSLSKDLLLARQEAWL